MIYFSSIKCSVVNFFYHMPNRNKTNCLTTRNVVDKPHPTKKSPILLYFRFKRTLIFVRHRLKHAVWRRRVFSSGPRSSWPSRELCHKKRRETTWKNTASSWPPATTWTRSREASWWSSAKVKPERSSAKVLSSTGR